MLKQLSRLTIVALVGLVLFSCQTDLKEPLLIIKDTQYKESVLIINAISGLESSQAIDVYINGAKTNDDAIAYAETSGKYHAINAGDVYIEVKLADQSIATIDANIELGKLYSIYVVGSKDDAEIIIKEDDINLDDPNSAHGITIANLSDESEVGLELEIYIMGQDSYVVSGFHTANGLYGIMTNFISVLGIPQSIMYKEIVTSTNFPADNLIAAYPCRFVISNSNTADKTITPMPSSTATYVVGQKLADLFVGSITNSVLFVADHHITMVVAGNSTNDDLITFNIDNTALYSDQYNTIEQ